MQLRYFNMNDHQQTGQISFKYIKFILSIVAIHILISLCFSYASKYYLKGILGQNTFIWSSAAEEFFAIVLFAPFVETWLLQVLTFKGFSYVINYTNLGKNIQNYLFILLSSLLFACLHTYNWLYAANAFFGGFLLNYSYIYFKKEKFYPYYAVVSIHLLYNLFGFIFKKTF